MTPGDLIADLRDIHTPQAVGEAAVWLSPAPLIVFAALLAAGAFWSHRRKTAWRRGGARRLDAIKDIGDPAERWAALITLFQLATRHSGGSVAPDYLFQPRDRLGADAEDRLIADIQRRLG